MKSPVNADCDALNRRFGAPGRIVFRPSPDTGAPVAVLANKYGTCEVDLKGAHVLSYRPTGQQQVFLLPKNMKVPAGKWTHGGVPLCWPWFGRSGEPGTPGHGFAHYQVFEVRGSEYSEESTEVTFGITATDETRKLWPYEFDLEVKVSISMSLNITMTAKNTGKEKFWYTEGFHPYFLLRGDGEPAKVRGVDGASFCDARNAKPDGSLFNAKDFTGAWSGDLTVDTDYDHVFNAKGGEYAIFDPGLKRTIVIRSLGNKKLVVWRPTPADCGGNMAPDDWKRMVCVEPATLFRDEGDWLEPGATHELRIAIQSDPNDGSVHSRN